MAVRIYVSRDAAAQALGADETAAALQVAGAVKGTPITLGRAVSLTETALRALAVPDPLGPGVIAGDENSPAYKNITATLVGDVIAVKWQASPVVPVNFVESVAYIQPYSGSASAAV